MALIVIRHSSIIDGAKLTAEDTMNAISIGNPILLFPIEMNLTVPAISSLGWVVATNNNAALTVEMNLKDWISPYTAPSM